MVVAWFVVFFSVQKIEPSLENFTGVHTHTKKEPKEKKKHFYESYPSSVKDNNQFFVTMN